MLEARLNEKDVYVTELKSKVADASRQSAEFSMQVHRLEQELTPANARLEGQRTLTEELRADMARQKTPEEKDPIQI